MDNPYRTSEPTDEIADYTRERQKRRSMDAPFLLLVLILMTIGLIMLLSASYARAYYEGSSPVSIFIRQLFFAAVGPPSGRIDWVLPSVTMTSSRGSTSSMVS